GDRARRPPLGHRCPVAARQARPGARGQRRDARAQPLHQLHLGVRTDRGAARDRRGRWRRARAPQPPAAAADRRGTREGDGVMLGSLVLTPSYYLVLGSMIFTIGAVGMLVRRNTLVMFMCIELMLNAVNLTFVTYSHALNDIGGQVAV